MKKKTKEKREKLKKRKERKNKQRQYKIKKFTSVENPSQVESVLEKSRSNQVLAKYPNLPTPNPQPSYNPHKSI